MTLTEGRAPGHLGALRILRVVPRYFGQTIFSFDITKGVNIRPVKGYYRLCTFRFLNQFLDF